MRKIIAINMGIRIYGLTMARATITVPVLKTPNDTIPQSIGMTKSRAT